jgi:hypothetical protein
MDEKRWKMNCDLDAPLLWEQAQTSTVKGLSFVKIDVWQFEWLPRNLILFHQLGYARLYGNWRVRIFTTKLTDTFSVSLFPCKSFDNKHTLFNSELHFSINFDCPLTPLTKTINATCCSDKIRPPADGRLSALMTHSAVGSYCSSLREMLCPLCAVAALPPSLNALY